MSAAKLNLDETDPNPIGRQRDLRSRIISAYPGIIRLYCFVRFKIIHIRFLEEIGPLSLEATLHDYRTLAAFQDFVIASQPLPASPTCASTCRRSARAAST